MFPDTTAAFLNYVENSNWKYPVYSKCVAGEQTVYKLDDSAEYLGQRHAGVESSCSRQIDR
ncbi:MAG: hypothetical protein ACLVHV_13475 [Oscillospiraceae bacterium]